MEDSDRSAGHVICVSAVVLSRPDGALVTVRKRGTDRFMLPGGKWESGESPRQCAVRELREELGVELSPDDLRRIGRFETETANEPGHTLVSEVFAASGDGSAEPAAEIAEARWVTGAEVEELSRLPEGDCVPWAPLLVRVARQARQGGPEVGRSDDEDHDEHDQCDESTGHGEM